MGKARKPKGHKNKLNPTGLVDAGALLDQELSNEKSDSPIQAIVEQLQSSSAEEKICGLQTLATICQNEVNIAAVVKSDVVRIAASLLVDPDQSVRHATAGAFRNLSVLSVQICEYMVDQDVLTPLLALLNKYTVSSGGEWKPTFDRNMHDQLDEKSDTFLQAVSLLWNLCESTSIALDSFNQSHLLESFVKYLDWQVYGKEIAIAVSQCVLVISEDNIVSWRILSSFGNELTSLLALDGDNSSILLRTVAAGIIANVPPLAVTYLGQLFATLSRTLEVNHRPALGSVTSSLPLLNQKDVIQLEVTDDTRMDDESAEQSFQRRRRADMPSEVELEVRNVGWLLQAQRIAAEILTNICSTEEEEWQDDMDDENLSDAESVHDYDTNGLDDSLQNTDKLPIEILEAVKSFGFVEKLWQKAQPIAENVRQILVENDRSLLKRVNNLRASSMLCLHNLCNNISTEDLGGAEAIYQVWLELGQQVFQGEKNPKLLEASTSLMRATLEHLRKSPELFRQMTESDLQLMLAGVNECKDPEIRANWLRMLGILGCLLSEPLIKLIIDLVLSTCLNEENLWTISEAMDSMMDIFAENDWNQIVHDLDMVAKCKELDRRMKSKLKQSKRELNERYPAVCTVRTNLWRFCKYLETEMKNFKPAAENEG
ncbi:HEAT repeat-containing protein 3 [Topomyia yanbarensis]|uniref:HEAT repeat-containing protein 3 n=1 Tax=Topomyia yanbarensis TaxID=2498891 RepID=UPI00273B6AE7|nr:HEAT repeat-containing protein 3 [Topomyia yanbarensis]